MSNQALTYSLFCIVIAAAIMVWSQSDRKRHDSETKRPDSSLASSSHSSQSSSRNRTAQPSRQREARFSSDEISISSLDQLTEESSMELTKLRLQSIQRLNQLAVDLDLSPAQQRAAFPLIARSSPFYREEFIVGDSSAQAALSSSEAQSDIYDLLDADQQDIFANSILDEQLWWQSIVDKLEEDLDADIATTTDENLPTETEEDDQEGFNLFDSLGK